MAYDYAVTSVSRVVDGDTVDLVIDLGFHMSALLRFRILNLNTPERGMPYWAESNAYTAEWLSSHTGLRAATTKADDFGRWLADIYDSTGAHLATDVKAYLMTTFGYDANYYPKIAAPLLPTQRADEPEADPQDK